MGLGPEGVGPPEPRKMKFRRVGAQNFAFFSSPFTIFLLSSLSWRSPCGMLVVFLKRRGPQMCTLGVLGLSCEAPGQTWILDQLRLAKLGSGKTWSGPTWFWPKLVCPKLAKARWGRSRRGRVVRRGVRRRIGREKKRVTRC